MRETLAARMISRSRMRITPAYAGNTIYQIFKVCKIRDHPRVCGKHRCNHLQLYLSIGSPPRMRETHIINVIELESFRITPAYAGNTEIFDRVQRDTGGSPPRMRETRTETDD